MSSTNVTTARKNLYRLVDTVNETHEPIHIYGKQGAAVLVGEKDWKDIQETLYLTSIPGMRESILSGMQEPLETMTDTLDW